MLQPSMRITKECLYILEILNSLFISFDDFWKLQFVVSMERQTSKRILILGCGNEQ
jgi:hypothetical protein